MSTGLLWGQPQCGRRTSGRPYICWSLCEAVGSRLDVKLVAVDGLLHAAGKIGEALRWFGHVVVPSLSFWSSFGSGLHAKLVAVDGLLHAAVWCFVNDVW